MFVGLGLVYRRNPIDGKSEAYQTYGIAILYLSSLLRCFVSPLCVVLNKRKLDFNPNLV